MQLIRKIEIHYLRSIYSAVLNDVADLNLFFGRNDSGKSNILRALNLFFNDETDPGYGFNFDLDMSDLRKKKATEAKGRQFVWIKITFNVPLNYQKSLGTEISVKRQWNRYGGDPSFVSSPVLTGRKSAQLTRFLNQIDYTYIPAIKDLEVYADLVQRVYASAAESTEMVEATDQFIQAIGAHAGALTEQLTTIFGNSASLAAPTDMATLFRYLDFAHGDDGHSLFKQKGDGIKARHLPELLRFINENEAGKRFFLWGFEEPENSLDLSAAAEEASRFANFSARSDTQIFVSSHSPAFYLAPACAEGEIRRYFVDKQRSDENGNIKPDRATTIIDNVEDADSAMRAAGLMQLPYVIHALKDQNEDLHKAKQLVENLQKQISALERPTLFVEGEHDDTAYPKLLAKFGVAEDCYDIQMLNGTPKNSKEFLQAIDAGRGLSSPSKALFLFDNDQAGRNSLKALAGKNADCSGSQISISQNLSTAVLPFKTTNFRDFMQTCNLPEDAIKFPFELLLVTEDLAQFVEEKIREKGDTDWQESIHNDYHKMPQQITNKMRKFELGTSGWPYARMVPDNLKKTYLNKAMDDLDTSCEVLTDLVATIRSSLGLEGN